jgi:hypothetical protein
VKCLQQQSQTAHKDQDGYKEQVTQNGFVKADKGARSWTCGVTASWLHHLLHNRTVNNTIALFQSPNTNVHSKQPLNKLLSQ